MTDDERPEEEPRRTRRAQRKPSPAGPSPRRNGRPTPVGVAARKAAEQVAALTGHDAETVISIEPCDGGWQIGIEVVETHRIPDSADILASYEVHVEADGELISYRRTRRYARGQLHGEGR